LKVNRVREYIRTISGFANVQVVESRINKGLRWSIINGVDCIISTYGKVIVLEDDLLVSEYFLQYMNEALIKYENEEKVMCIHGYSYPSQGPLPETFFLRGAECWGWATWKRGWDLFEPDGNNLIPLIKDKNDFNINGSIAYWRMLVKQAKEELDSWAICWFASAYVRNKLNLWVGRSLVTLIETDSYTHTKSIKHWQTKLAIDPIRLNDIPIQENQYAREVFAKTFWKIQPSLLSKIRRKILYCLRWKFKPNQESAYMNLRKKIA